MFTSLKHTTCHTAYQLVYDLVGIETQAMRKCSVRLRNRPHRAVNSRVRRKQCRPDLQNKKRFETQFGEVVPVPVVRFDLEGISLGPLFPTRGRTLLQKTRFFYAREAGRPQRSLKPKQIKPEKLSQLTYNINYFKHSSNGQVEKSYSIPTV